MTLQSTLYKLKISKEYFCSSYKGKRSSIFLILVKILYYCAISHNSKTLVQAESKFSSKKLSLAFPFAYLSSLFWALCIQLSYHSKKYVESICLIIYLYHYHVLNTSLHSKANNGAWRIAGVQCMFLSFRTALVSQQNWAGSTEFPYTPCTCTHTASPLSVSWTKVVHFFIVSEPKLIHYYHPKSIVYNSIHSWCCTFYGFWQMCNDMYLSFWYHTEYSHCP